MAGKRTTGTVFMGLLSLGIWLALGGTTARASDGKIPIYGPTTISSPGSYYLTRDVGGSSSFTSVITITAPAVTLDLGGHSIEVVPSTYGINVQGVGDVHIRNGMILDGAYGLYATSWGVVHLESVLFASQSTNAVLIERSAVGVTAQALIERCTFNGCASPISLAYCNGGRIQGNNFKGSTGRAIQLDHCNGNTVDDNTISGSIDGYCIYLGTCQGGLVTRNLMANVTGTTIAGGLYCDYCYGCTISENSAQSVSGGPGFRFSYGSVSNRIQGNTAAFTSTGFWLQSESDHNTLQGNVAISATYDGFLIQTSYNLLEGNTAISNSGFGFNIGTNANVLVGNRAINNGSGNWSVLCGGVNTCVEYGSGYPTNIPGP